MLKTVHAFVVHGGGCVPDPRDETAWRLRASLSYEGRKQMRTSVEMLAPQLGAYKLMSMDWPDADRMHQAMKIFEPLVGQKAPPVGNPQFGPSDPSLLMRIHKHLLGMNPGREPTLAEWWSYRPEAMKQEGQAFWLHLKGRLTKLNDGEARIIFSEEPLISLAHMVAHARTAPITGEPGFDPTTDMLPRGGVLHFAVTLDGVYVRKLDTEVLKAPVPA